MKKQLSNLLLLILIILSILFSTLVWEKISLPFNDQKIIGEYADKKFNPSNDILRYLIFVFLPIIIFFSQVFFNKEKLQNLTLNLKKKLEFNVEKNNSILFFFFLFIILISLEFLSTDFQLHSLDLLHEGQQLSSSYKNNQDGSLWSGSYVTIGIFLKL